MSAARRRGLGLEIWSIVIATGRVSALAFPKHFEHGQSIITVASMRMLSACAAYSYVPPCLPERFAAADNEANFPPAARALRCAANCSTVGYDIPTAGPSGLADSSEHALILSRARFPASRLP